MPRDDSHLFCIEIRDINQSIHIICVPEGCALYIFYSYATSAIGSSAVVYTPFLDAIIGGYGNTVHADFALILGILVIIMHLTLMITTSSMLGRVLRFLTGRIFGVIVFLIDRKSVV